jgi:nucleoside-diphosphate-sugar epimerase
VRILVTGASGLIGSALVDRLRVESSFVATTSRGALDHPSHYQADLERRDEAAALVGQVEPDMIVHLAGVTAGERHQLYGANTLTTLNILSAVAERLHSANLVIAGSAAEYGAGDDLLDETAPLRPLTDYGRAKAAATTLAEIVAGQRGLRLTIVRPFNVVSNRLPTSTALGNFRQQLLNQSGSRRSIRVGRLDVVRDFVPLHFVVEAISLLTLGGLEGTYNICSGVGITLGSILAEMARTLGVRTDIKASSELLAISGADRIVGNPAKLEHHGLRTCPTAASLAQLCLSDDPQMSPRGQ